MKRGRGSFTCILSRTTARTNKTKTPVPFVRPSPLFARPLCSPVPFVRLHSFSDDREDEQNKAPRPLCSPDGSPYPPGTIPYNPGEFNYVTIVGNYCAWLTHGIADGNQIIRVCKGKNGKPPICGTKLENRMLCLTCHKDCLAREFERALLESFREQFRYSDFIRRF